MSPSLGSLFKRREEKVFTAIEDYAKVVKKTVESFERLSEAVKDGEFHRLKEIYEEIDRDETDADGIRRNLSEELCRGTFFAHLREDLLNLLERIDDIADWAKDAAKIIVETSPQWEILYFVFNLPEMDKYVRASVEIAEKLINALRVLREEGRKVTPLLHEIEDIEEEADELKMTVTKKLLREAYRFNIIDVLQVKEMIYLLDNVFDSAEDASDIILLMVAKGYG